MGTRGDSSSLVLFCVVLFALASSSSEGRTGAVEPFFRHGGSHEPPAMDENRNNKVSIFSVSIDKGVPIETEEIGQRVPIFSISIGILCLISSVPNGRPFPIVTQEIGKSVPISSIPIGTTLPFGTKEIGPGLPISLVQTASSGRCTSFPSRAIHHSSPSSSPSRAIHHSSPSLTPSPSPTRMTKLAGGNSWLSGNEVRGRVRLASELWWTRGWRRSAKEENIQAWMHCQNGVAGTAGVIKRFDKDEVGRSAAHLEKKFLDCLRHKLERSLASDSPPSKSGKSPSPSPAMKQPKKGLSASPPPPRKSSSSPKGSSDSPPLPPKKSSKTDKSKNSDSFQEAEVHSRILAIAVAATAAGTFFFALVVFLCCCLSGRSKNRPGSDDDDDDNSPIKLTSSPSKQQTGPVAATPDPKFLESSSSTTATKGTSSASVPLLKPPPGKKVVMLPAPLAPPPPPPPPPGPPPPPPPKARPPGPPPPPVKGARPPPPPSKGAPLPPKRHSRGSSLSGDADDPNEDPDAPKTKLKPFFWDKVAATGDHEMVWNEIKAGSFQFNEEEMESLFGYAIAERKKPDRKKEAMENGVQYIKIIDPRKAQNLSILLRALNVTTDEFVECLQEGTTLPAELLQTVLKMAPTQQEELKLRVYNGDIALLGPAERFLKTVIEIPFAFKRMETLLFMSLAHDEVVTVKESLGTLEVASGKLKNSRLFLKLLEAVLKTGNRMNDGTYRGGAQAFKLDTLLKLADVKGTDGKTTLLHFVVQEIMRSEGIRAVRPARESQSFSSLKSEELLEDINHDATEHYRNLGLQVVSGLSNELQDVKKAAVIDADMVSGAVSKLQHSVTKAREFLNTEIKTMEEATRFCDALTRFVEQTESDVAWLSKEEKRITALVESTADYFHGNAGKSEGLRLFSIVRDFLQMVDKVCREIKEMAVEQAKAAKRENLKPTASPARENHSPEAPLDQEKETPLPPPHVVMRQKLFPAIADRRVDDSSSDDED